MVALGNDAADHAALFGMARMVGAVEGEVAQGCELGSIRFRHELSDGA